jgi:hypothetical protein
MPTETLGGESKVSECGRVCLLSHSSQTQDTQPSLTCQEAVFCVSQDKTRPQSSVEIQGPYSLGSVEIFQKRCRMIACKEASSWGKLGLCRQMAVDPKPGGNDQRKSQRSILTLQRMFQKPSQQTWSRSVLFSFFEMLHVLLIPVLISSLIKDLRLYLHFFPLENQIQMMCISVIFPVFTVSVLLHLFYFHVD